MFFNYNYLVLRIYTHNTRMGLHINRYDDDLY
jgi:hypothetical protein